MTAQEHLNELKAKIDKRIADGDSYRKSTRPENVYGWSVAEHEAMRKLAMHYEKQGCIVSRQVNWGATDWEIIPELVIE